MRRYHVWLQRAWHLSKNKWFRRGLRVGRTGVVAFGLYKIGYTAGIHDYVRDPDKHDNGFTLSALGEMNAR